MKRKRNRETEDDLPGLTCCKLCKSEGQGKVYDFWSGYREKLERHEYFDHITIRGRYSDVTPLHVFVCDRCVSGLQRQKYLPRAIGWGLLCVPGLLGLLVALVLLFRADQASAIICLCFALFLTVPAVVVALVHLWLMFRPVPDSPGTDKLVLHRLRAEKGFGKKGYELFTAEEYATLFGG